MGGTRAVPTMACHNCGASMRPGEVVCLACGADVISNAGGPPRETQSLQESLSTTLETHLLENLVRALLGEYEIVARLGRGGMCAVYLARDLVLNREVAVKVVLPEMVSAFSTAQHRLKREARTAAALSHPNIIPVYAVREASDLVFLVMKYVEGQTLAALLKEHGRLPVETSLAILFQVASGLEYAHQQGVIHRDIKPPNIMIDTQGWAILTDFGLAKVRDGQDLTATGTALGTPRYMSPEQASGEPLTSASDQYSLGVVAYEMLTGKPPFQSDTIASIVTQHLFDKPDSIQELEPKCPPEVSAAVMRMLEKRPEDRFPSVRQALSQIVEPDLNAGRSRLAQLVENSSPVELGEYLSTPTSPDIGRADGSVVQSKRRGSILTKSAFMWTTVAVLLVVAVSVTVTLGINRFIPGQTDSLPLVTNVQALVPAGNQEAFGTDDLAMSNGATESGDESRAETSEQPASRDEDVSLPETADDGTHSMAAPAVPQPTGTGTVLLGTRGLTAVLYVDGKPSGVIDRLESWSVPAGTVRLSIRMDGCQPWDSTVTVRPDEQVRVGYRKPNCPP